MISAKPKATNVAFQAMTGFGLFGEAVLVADTYKFVSNYLCRCLFRIIV
jgi:hypothetical protein